MNILSGAFAFSRNVQSQLSKQKPIPDQYISPTFSDNIFINYIYPMPGLFKKM